MAEAKADSDIEIVDERPLDTVILLDTDNDSDDFVYEADERQDVIELGGLDGPLGKSSNIPSPTSEGIEEPVEMPKPVEGVEEAPKPAETRTDVLQSVPKISVDTIESKDLSETKPDKDYWVTLSSEPNLDVETGGDGKAAAHNKAKDIIEEQKSEPTGNQATDGNEPKGPATDNLGTVASAQHETTEEGVTSNVHSSQDAQKNNKTLLSSPLNSNANGITQASKSTYCASPNEKVSGDPLKAHESSEPNNATESPKKSSPTESSSTNSIQTPSVSQPATNSAQDTLPKDTQHNEPEPKAQITQPSTKPVVKEVPKPRPSSIEDDFFSMNYPLPVPEIRKKKKKKLKRKLSEEPTSASGETSNTTTPQLEPAAISTEAAQDPNSQPPLQPSEDETPKKKKRLARPLTPPPFDEESFKEAYNAKMNALRETANDSDPTDTIFDEDDRYKQTLAQLEKMRKSFESEKQTSDAASREGSEEPGSSKSRKYILHIASFLPGSQNNALDIDVKGNKKFHAVISKTLSYLLGLDIVPSAFKVLYVVDQVTLYWNKMRIQDFMRPDSLNIPEPSTGEPTVIELGLYTKTQASEIERFRQSERVEKYKKLAQQEAMDAEAERLEREEREREKHQLSDGEAEDPFKDDELFKSIENEKATDGSREATLQPNNENLEEGYFKIGLKGEDNKKIIVKVHAETQISKLVEHFINKKGLPPTTKLRLVFDDEDIELDGTVGDTELEEDFAVDVIVLK